MMRHWRGKVQAFLEDAWTILDTIGEMVQVQLLIEIRSSQEVRRLTEYVIDVTTRVCEGCCSV